MDSLEKVMSLLAFPDISKSPLADLVENSQRIKISSEVNYELLKSQSKEKGAFLPPPVKNLIYRNMGFFRLRIKIAHPD